MKILIVDDELEIASAICIALERRGHDCLIAGSTQAALEALDRQAFDFVLADLVMPEMSGVELYDALVSRGNPVAKRMGFISAFVRSYENAAFLRRTGRPFLAKPFGIAELRAFVEAQAPR